DVSLVCDQLQEIDLVVVLGGPMNIYEEDKFPWLIAEKKFIRQAIEEKLAVLGLCLGSQLIADVLGAKIYPNDEKEIGWFPVEVTEAALKHRLFSHWPNFFTPFHWHGDTFDLPEGAIHLARSQACRNQAFLYQDRVVGLQFHLEINLA